MTSGRRLTRIRVLLHKEWLDLRRNYGALAPIAIVTLIALVVPFAITFGIPALTGEQLAGDSDLLRMSGESGAPLHLAEEARVQYFLLQQFLLLFLLTPITGAMTLASHAVVGEKQARTLEPLLATPLSTMELLVAKVLGALAPSQAMAGITLVAYLLVIARFAEPGVTAAMLNGRTAVLVLWVGPAASLAALQAAILVSSRVNDPRTAQQVGVLIIVPIAGLIVAQFVGAVWLTAARLFAIGAGLLIAWLLLLAGSVAVFRRESILTRWR